MLISFYEYEELVDAKEQLLKTVQLAINDVDGDSEMPRLPRRQGEHKDKQTADDLLKLFTIIDERNLGTSLPYFTARNLSRIPFVNADSVSVITMAKKLEILKQRMNSFELVLLNPTPQSCGGTDNESRIPVKSHIDNPATDQDIVSAATPGCSSVDETDIVPKVGKWFKVSHKKNSKKRGKKDEPASPTYGKGGNHGGRQRLVGARSHVDGKSLKTGVEIVEK